MQDTTVHINTLYVAGVPRRFIGKTFDNYVATTERQKEVLAFARGFWRREKPGMSAVFTGRPGTGKTHLAMGIVAEGAALGYSTRLTTMREIARGVRMCRHPGGSNDELLYMRGLISRDLLVIDDVCPNSSTRLEHSLLVEILEMRYDDMSPTILISNKNLDGIKKYLGERIIDRLREDGGRLFVFDWESARGAPIIV